MSSQAFRDTFNSRNWAASPVGAVGGWPLHLGKSVEFMLDTPQPMFLIWGREKTLLFNEGFSSILGSRWAEALGHALPELWKSIWDKLEPFVQEAFSGRGGLIEDVPLATWASNFAETRYYTFSYTPVRGTAGEVVGGACICTDTTSKVCTAATAERQRNALMRLFEHAPGFIAMTEGPLHRFTFANAAFLSFLNVHDVIGRTVSEAVPSVAAQGFVDLLDQVYATGESFVARAVPVEIAGQGGDFETRYANFVYEPVRGDDGRVIGLFCEGQDVTEEKAALEQVQSLQTELIHVSRASAMGAMASTLAHELNQPLAAISSYASAGAAMFGENPLPVSQISQCLEGIRTAALRAGDVIRSVRRVTQQESTQIDEIDLETLVAEAANLSLMGRTQSGVAVTYRLEPGIRVRADAIQIQQVVMNLIRNAIEAMASSPRREIILSTCSRADGALLCVEDSGPGVDPHLLPSLFEAFVTTKDAALGMGLAISRTIIEAHGGSIWASNKADGGSAFCFTIPVAAVRSIGGSETRAA